MITIVDYGLGNLGSIKNMLKKIGVESVITGEPQELLNATKLILPGVGAFDDGMRNLQERGLIEILNKRVLEDKVPVLGICLGMQLMAKTSEEGKLTGLGWIDAQVKRFPEQVEGNKLRIPHMGWNVIYPKNNSDKEIFKHPFEELRFYFVHSYYVETKYSADIIATSNYGIEFVSAFRKDDIFGMQYHPEKSHKFGMEILRNFTEINVKS